MKKKILAFTLVIVMLAIAIVGGTLAYFTDTDEAKNTMTVGNIAIEQTEWQRNANHDGFVVFEQDKLMMPAVYAEGSNDQADYQTYFNDADSLNIANGQAWSDFWSEENGQYNALDKIVVVENTGDYDVYYRTLIAIEAPTDDWNDSWGGESGLVMNYNSNNRFTWDFAICQIEINGVKYIVHEALYTDVLTPEEMSRPSLLQVMFDNDTTQEEVAAYGDTVDILCLTQAVQVEGFDQVGGADVALNTAFGEVDAVNAAAWFAPIA